MIILQDRQTLIQHNSPAPPLGMKRAITPPPFFSPRKLREYAVPPTVVPKIHLNTERGPSRIDVAANEHDVLKIMSWNCDGLLKYLSQVLTGLDTFVQKKKEIVPKPSFLADLLSRHKPDIMCLQEVHLWDHELKQVTKQLQVDAPDYKFHSCLPIGKGGRRRAGVLTLYKECLPQVSTSTVPWDQEGRVSILEMHNLAIYNVYCLNSSENEFKDPMTGVVKGTRSQRKREFDSLLAKAMEAETSSGKEVLLLGDLNISRYPIDALGGHLRLSYPHKVNRDHFNGLFSSYRDIIRERYPDSPKFTWFSRAANGDKARVDMILGNDAIQVLDADTIEEPLDRAQSDHGPQFIRIRHTLESSSSST